MNGNSTAPARKKIKPGSDDHLTLLMAPHSLNLVTGQDRQHLLSWGRDVWNAALAAQQPAEQEPLPAGRIAVAVAVMRAQRALRLALQAVDPTMAIKAAQDFLAAGLAAQTPAAETPEKP